MRLSFASLIQCLLSCSNDAASCWSHLAGTFFSLGKVCLKASWVSFNRASLCAMYRCRLLALYCSSLFASAWGSCSTPSHLRLRVWAGRECCGTLSTVTYPWAVSPFPSLLWFSVSVAGESLRWFFLFRSRFFLVEALILGTWSWDWPGLWGGTRASGKMSGGKDTARSFSVGKHYKHVGKLANKTEASYY